MTIYIDRETTNVCIFTLNESTTLILPKYILQVVSKATDYDKIMWLNDDISTNTIRFNKYIIEEVNPEDEDLENMKINLPSTSYDFFVWETSSNNLDLSEANKIIESGNIIVNGDIPVIPIYNGRNVKTTFKKK